MVKFRRLAEKDIAGDSLQRWLTWFDKGSSEEAVREVEEMDAAIRKISKRMAEVSRDKEALHSYHMREMALSDWTSGVNYAEKKGEQRILDLLKSGASPEEILRRYPGR